MSKSIYAPLYNDENLAKESADAYIKRIQLLLPHFPKDVLIQWFHDHDQQIKNHEWLNYPSLRFEIKEWTTDNIPIENYGNVEGVKINMAHFKGTRNIYTDRLISYFENYGTWPVPPIYLPNPAGNIEYPGGYPCGTPYHLIEGHHRMAFFLSLRRKINWHQCMTYILLVIGEYKKITRTYKRQKYKLKDGQHYNAFLC